VSWSVPVLGGFLDTTHALPDSLPGFVYLNQLVIENERQWEEPSHIFTCRHKIETLLETQQCKKLKCLVVTTLAMA
jgi:hypothetical protein